ncbi:MAG: hypothetical protein FWG73_04220 [Planctomycetaceae bacterium]|nr:hypothetical protein [Planctomycetaceae bacterium]
MNKHLLSIFSLAVLSLSLHAFAQPNEEGEARFMMYMNDQMFVWNPEIADVLNLTPEQKAEIQKVTQEYQAQQEHQQRILQGEITGNSHQNFQQSFAEIREGVNGVLEPEQRAKFGEMTFQLSGGLGGISVNNQMLEHVLDLTPAQQEQINEIVKARNIAFTNDPDIVKRHADLVKAVLRPEQIMELEKLTAEIPALRERLNMPTQVRRVPAPAQQAPVYAPGAGSWQPGMPLPTVRPLRERGGFPRPQ